MCLGLFICFRTDYSRLHAASAAEVDDLGGMFDVKCSRNVQKTFLKETWKESTGQCEMVLVSDLSDHILISLFHRCGITTVHTHSTSTVVHFFF